jgi:hypothetical protein
MDKKELIAKLNILGVDSNLYSLDGELNPDCIILYNSYNDWTVFYLDERGVRNDEKIFHSESKAYEYIYKLFKESKDLEKKNSRNKSLIMD